MSWENQYFNQQNQAGQERNRANRATSVARYNAEQVRQANATIQELNQEVQRLANLARFNDDVKECYLRALNSIHTLETRSAAPGVEALRQLALQMYIGDLVGANSYFPLVWEGKDGYNWLDAMRMGLHRDGIPLDRDEKRAINLKIMVRCEFWTFAKITKKLNAFQTKVLEALTHAKGSHPELRDPRLVDIVLREVKAHNDWIAQLEAAPKGDLTLQHQWEAERLAWWQQHAAYEQPKHTIPKFRAMLKKNPDIRVDDFHAGGRIARDAGWDMIDMKPGKYYVENTVACFFDGPRSFKPQDMML